MSYSDLFAISAAGMDIARRRVEVAALNLANANTVAGTNGKIYQPQRVVAHAYGTSGPAFDDLMETGVAAIPIATVESLQAEPRKVYEPGHPMADDRGFVSYSRVDSATEMVTIMSAMRSYEANIAAMNAARAMTLKAMDIGGGA